MKKTNTFLRYMLFVALVISSLTIRAQQAQMKTITYDGVQRQWLQYVPSSYNATNPTAVIFLLHGLGDTVQNAFNLSGLKPIADKWGWILVVPQALAANISIMGYPMNLGTMWNAGISCTLYGTTIAPNSTVDDQGFLMTLLDTMESNYNISTDSVFFGGFSMGGFMSHTMGINHSDRIKAIAAVSGTISSTMQSRTPINNLRVLHIHGTKDSVVSYTNASFPVNGLGTFSLGLSAQQTVDYWIEFNSCNPNAAQSTYSNRCNDSLSFERYDYTGENNGSQVSFIKVIGGTHSWYSDTNTYDISYAQELYKFFAGKDFINVSLAQEPPKQEFSICPNPASSNIRISASSPILSTEICYIDGKVIRTYNSKSTTIKIDITDIKSGFYIIKIRTTKGVVTKKLIVQ
jgi:Poly(3-hydroxybutyrate) depolymerase